MTLLVASMVLLGGCSSGGSSAPGTSSAASGPVAGNGTIAVSTPAFDDGGAIPTQFTCDGAGVSPPLAWSDVPAGARSVALVVDDQDAPGGTFTHWVLAGLPASDGVLEEDAGTPGNSVTALNSAGAPGWTPPCPPSGTHRYRFTFYALSGGAPFTAGAVTTDALRAIAAAAVAHGTLTGTYTRTK